MKKIKDVTLKIEADVNLAPVREKIAKLRQEIKSDPLKFAVEVEDSKIVDSLAEAHQLYEDNPLNIVATTDTTPAENALRVLREEFRHFPSTITANAHTAGAEAQLATLTRRRSVGIFASLNIAPDIKNALKGISYTIMGAIPADKVRASVTGILANFESLAIGAAKISMALGSVGAMALTTGSNLLTFSADVGRTIGLLNTVPSIFTAMGLAMVGFKLGFKDFGAAFDTDAKKAAEAMAKLPKQAQEAVKAMKGLGAEIRKDSQGAFWEEMGTSLQDMVKSVFPAVKNGLHGTSIATAKMTKGMLASFKELAESGGMDKLFENINKGLTSASNAVKPFFDAMNTISLTGSKHLERYGINLTKLAEKFDAWADRTSKSGEMDQWITQAEANMKNLGSIIGETSNIFKGLTQAAAQAGGKSLADFANGMKNLAGIINSEPFQTKLVSILLGARDGVEALGRGFDKIKKLVSDGTTAISGFLALTGQIGGSLMENLAAMFDGTGLGAGLIAAMDGAKKAMDEMKPAFSDLGQMMGDIGEIAGVLFQEMAPGFVNLADTLQKVVEALRQGVMDVIPVFNEFIQNILMVIAPIIVGVAGAIGGLLEGFAALPEVVRNAIMAFGLFLAVLRLLNRPMKDTQTGIRNLSSPLQNVQDRVRGLRDGLVNKWNTSGTIAAAGQAFSGLAASASVAAGAIGTAFRQMGWMAGHTAQAIGEGFRRTFSQMGDQMRKLAAPVKNFASMMAGAMGEALFPRDVRDGFRQVGAKLAEVARIYTGYFTAAKDKIAGIGKAIAGALPASLLGSALKALPGEVGKTMAWAAQKVAGGVADIAKTLAGPAVGFAMGKMREVIAAQALYASKRLEDIGKGMQTAVQAIKNAPAAAAGALRSLGGSISSAFATAQQAMAKAFNAGVLAAAIHPMTAPFVKMADAAKAGATAAAGHISSMARTIGTAVSNITAPTRIAFATLADAAKNAALTAGTRFSTAFRDAARDLSTVGTNMSATMGRVFSGIQTAATTTASHVTDTMRRAGSAISSNFGPAVAAVKGHFEGIASAVRIAAAPIGDLARSAGTAAGTVGALAGATAKWAGSGLLSALGGGWGLAIAGATAAITAIADAQAKSKARIEAFTGSLDQQTGAITNLTKNLMLKSLFDGQTDAWDDFVRGVIENSKTVTETLEALDMDTRKYFQSMADPGSRDKMIKGMDQVIDNLRTGKQTSKELAESLGMSVEALTGLSGREANIMANSLEHAQTKAKDMGDELKRAEEQVKLVAKATGVNSAEAAIMAKNYGILADATSSVSDKFSAFKENLRLMGSVEEKAQLGQKGYQQSLRDTKSRIKDIVDANSGLLLPSLFDVQKGFDFTRQAGADLHSALDQQVSGIQMLGTEAIQKALAEGKKGEAVQQAALDAMKPAIDALRQNLKDLDFSPEQIAGILDTFNLMDKDIISSISLEGAEKVRKDLAMLTIAKDLFVKGDYTATLKVLPDEAKAAIEKATGVANGFKDGKYEAMLSVLDSTEGGRTAALAKLMTVVDGKWDAELTAMDLTGETVEAAKKAAEEKWKGKSFAASLTVDKGPFQTRLDEATKNGVDFSGKTYSPLLNADGTPFDDAVLNANGKGTIFDSTTYTSKMAADNAAFDAATNAANAKGNTFDSTTFTSKVDANKAEFDGKVSGATISGTTLGEKVFKPTINADDYASAKIKDVNDAKIDNKSFSISAFLDDTVANVRRFLGFADGGIVNGAGVQTFANGGIMKGARNTAVKAFANGGVENHVAQITRPGGPVRIWSEPETQGEAYLPLAKSKRARSLKILDEVADLFGYNLSKKIAFANGGIIKSMPARSPSVSRSDFAPRTQAAVVQSAASPTVITNVYPSAGLNETQVADSVSENIYWKLSTQI
jgi:hypothetical protein